ncbi:hypothetical protein ACI79C_24960 [Geodermatophilus sp. SYSU D00697]
MSTTAPPTPAATEAGTVLPAPRQSPEVTGQTAAEPAGAPMEVDWVYPEVHYALEHCRFCRPV